MSDTPPACDQCGTRTWELFDAAPYGALCSRCWYRQETYEHPDE